MKKEDRESFLKLQSYLSAVPKELHQKFIALYIYFKEEAFIIFQVLRGETVSFPDERIIRGLSRKVRGISLLEMPSDILVESKGRYLPAKGIKINTVFQHKGSMYRSKSGVVELESVLLLLVEEVKEL